MANEVDEDDVFFDTIGLFESQTSNKYLDKTNTIEQEADEASAMKSVAPAEAMEDQSFHCENNRQGNLKPDNKFHLQTTDPLNPEKDFLEYMLSLSGSLGEGEEITRTGGKGKSVSGVSVSNAKPNTKIGLDHLDNLCKLMEQLSDLREANTKLQKRVQYLEDIKSLHDMHREVVKVLSIDVQHEPTYRQGRYTKGCNQSVTYTENPRRVRYKAKGRQFSVQKSKTQFNIPESPSTVRERSKSVGHEEMCEPKGSNKKKFPKWFKFKEALGWERGNQESGRTGGSKGGRSEKRLQTEKLAKDVFRGDEGRRVLWEEHLGALGIPVYLEYPDHEGLDPEKLTLEELMGTTESLSSPEGSLYLSEENLLKKGEAPAARQSSAREKSESSRRHERKDKFTPSPTSSTRGPPGREDIRDSQERSNTIDQECEGEQPAYQEDTKKSHKGPWRRVKTMIQTRRDSLRRKHRKNESGKKREEKIDTDPVSGVSVEISVASDEEEGEIKDEDDRTDDELGELRERKISNRSVMSISKKGSSQNISGLQEQRISCTDDWVQEPARDTHGINVVAKGTVQQERKKKPKSLSIPTDEEENSLPPIWRTSATAEDNPPTPHSSPPFHRKSRWTKVKKVFSSKREDDVRYPRSQSVPSSPASVEKVSHFDYDEKKIEDEGQLQEDETNIKEAQSPDVAFSDSYTSELSAMTADGSLQVLMPSSSAPMASIVQELQRNLSEDFNRKIQEWERKRGNGWKPPSPSLERKGSSSRLWRSKTEKDKPDRIEKVRKNRMKDLNWLEKELQKVEREKQRLAKQKRKYEERAVQLQRLREAVFNAQKTNKKEVLVRTSAGEFRFEGISDAFTKKLYEWETKRGVQPELSTIALLDASMRKPSFSPRICLPSDRAPSLQRGISRSETSIPDAIQSGPSPCTSLPSLQHDTSQHSERIQLSRANSEPDLSSFNSNKEMGFKQRSHSDDTVGSDRVQSYAPPEVTQLIDSDSEEAVLYEKKWKEERELQEASAQEDNYYTLLEENMFLLEQLKTKEGICRRLEEELETLDDKMEEMNARHQKELELYKDKLWKLHCRYCKPTDLQDSLRLISQLKFKVDELEQCCDRLKYNRETLEDSFRYHSEQQARLTRDFIDKMKELQEKTNSQWVCPEAQEEPAKKPSTLRLNSKNVAKLQHLSTELLQQARNIECQLAARNSQVCQLRWEVLRHEVATMRLHTELRHARWKGNGSFSVKRTLMARRRGSRPEKHHSWSSSEKLKKQDSEEERQTDNKFGVCKEWERIEYLPSDLSNIAQQLKVELLKLCSNADVSVCSSNGSSSPEQPQKIYQVCDQPIADIQDKVNEPYESPSSTHAHEFPTQVMSPKLSVRRNSDGQQSLSGQDVYSAPEYKDGEQLTLALKVPEKQWRSNSPTLYSDNSFIENNPHISGPSNKSLDETCKKIEYSKPKDFITPLKDRDVGSNVLSSTRAVDLKLDHYQKTPGTRKESLQKEQFSDEIKNLDIFFPSLNTDHDNSTCNITTGITKPTDLSGKTNTNVDGMSTSQKMVNNDVSEETTEGLVPELGKSKESQSDPDEEEMILRAAPFLRGESPVIRSRSPRKLKKETSREKPTNEPEGYLSDSKSRTVLTHVSQEGSPSVKNLIEKYNRKVKDSQHVVQPPSPRGDGEMHCWPQMSEVTQPKQLNEIKHFSLDPEYNRTISETVQFIPSLSPASRARAAALLKAKEDFITQTSVMSLKADMMHGKSKDKDVSPSLDQGEESRKDENGNRSNRWESMPCTGDDSHSVSSMKSIDSMSEILFKSEEKCQESKTSNQETTEDSGQASDKRRSVCTIAATDSSASLEDAASIPKSTANTKIRKPKKKKDQSAISALCRQSLTVTLETQAGILPSEALQVDASKGHSSNVNPLSPHPISNSGNQERPKGWLSKNIFKPK
ncbi:uncharacterized protein LOC106457881 isoform X2 [Limulus polyphemus]|uniref:Uncharacterized protein LOC106457881 isoform X2 n=1 Tax=Limulus polyphemus TaxID=6850 RepID=A0ABM1S7P6_LIMPO|nr:uncharacterized protein LOC106457881 isoform X2 [Limulus polyphemus]